VLSVAAVTTRGHRRRSRTRSYQPRGRVSSNRAQAKPSTAKGETARAQPQASTCERGQQNDYTYTANGELETKTNRDTGEAWLFQYDALGNLLTVALPNGDLVEYLVDGMGRRVGKKKNGVLLRQWIYRDALKPVAELDGSGNLVAEFVYGSKTNVPDYVRRGGNMYRVISDQLGSPRYVVNVGNAGDVPFTANYTSFGEVTGTGLDWMPFGFAGGIYDGDSGLVRFGARDMDPSIGRWTAKDPILFDGDGPDLYAYGLNDPINNLDPNGKGAGGCAFNLARMALACSACAATRSPLVCTSCSAATIAAAGSCQPTPPSPPPAGPTSCGTEGTGPDPSGGYGGRNDGSAGYAGRSDGSGGGGRGSQGP
jgi:RHS repeat-associated protein